MSTRMILVPLDRYRVDFEVGLGTPFSRLDTLVLRAISDEQATSIEALSDLMLLPRRLLIESIVSLSRAGWVAVGGIGKEFSVTPIGQSALSADVLPTPERVIAKLGSVLVERLTGQVATLRDLTFWTAKRLQEAGLWDQCERLPRSANVVALDAGQAKPLLSRDRNEWIRWIGEPIPQQEVWLKVGIDTENATASGIPEVWANALLPTLAKVLGIPELARRSRQDQEQQPTFHRRREARNVRADQVQLILSGADHRALLRTALREAQSQIVIASAFANADVLEADIKPGVLDALSRGVRVDLLWGYAAGSNAEEQERTMKVLSSIRKSSGQGQLLRFNEKPSGSHAKLLLWNTAKGFAACVGSNNWLSVPDRAYAASHHEVSILTSDIGLCADICTTVAGIWARAETAGAGANDLWHRTSSDLERALALQGPAVAAAATRDLKAEHPDSRGLEAALIRDQEHESTLRELVLGARRRIAVVSHKLGAAGQIRLASAKYSEPNPARELHVVVGEQPENPGAVEQFEAFVQDLGGQFRIIPGVHAKLVVADDAVLVSSYNFLSADPFAKAEGAREVGVLLRGEKVSDAVWDWVAAREGRDA